MKETLFIYWMISTVTWEHVLDISEEMKRNEKGNVVGTKNRVGILANKMSIMNVVLEQNAIFIKTDVKCKSRFCKQVMDNLEITLLCIHIVQMN